MAIYRFPSESLIDEVHVLTNEKGGLRAYLYADNSSDTEQLRRIKQGLRAEGMKCVPTTYEDKPVLEVRGFSKADALLAQLHALHALKGTAQFTPEPGDQRTSKEKWQNSTLRLAGLSYIVGDFSYLYYAYRQFRDENRLRATGNHSNFFNILNIVAGFGYMLGSSVLSVYGSRDQSLNTINAANQKIYAHLRKEGIPVDAGSTLKTAIQEKDKGFFGNISHFLAKFPAETLNAIYVFVGLILSSASIYRATRPIAPGLNGKMLAAAKQERINELWDVGLGAVTATSAIAGLVIKEKKPIEGEPKRTGLGGVIDWIQEKPLRATGYGFMLATLFHAKSTYGRYKSGDEQVKKTVLFRGLFVLANIFSEVMLAFSSKGHGTGVKPDQSVDSSVIAATAELIVRQPLEKREMLIENMAGFMASRDILDLNTSHISAELRTHIKALEHSPWTKHYVPGNPANAMTADTKMPSQDKPNHFIQVQQGSHSKIHAENQPTLQAAPQAH